MKFQHMQSRHMIIDTIIYIGSFLLLWEWLRPLEEITDTQYILVFVLYTGFCFFLSYMQLKWWITSPLKLIGLIVIIDGIFFYHPLLSEEWRKMFFTDFQFNLEAIFHQHWWEMTPIFRSMLFLILLWLMSYLLYYWFVIAKKVVFFVFLTFIYLTVIDTFTVYDAKYAIIRTFIISLVIVGLANFQRILIREKLFRIPKDKYMSWITPLVSVILISCSIGYIAPKFSPQWPDPVPFLRSAAESVTGSGGAGEPLKKVGYGENDERLGGSFVQDTTVVFHAVVQERQYWKIETKDVYTGKGWIRSNEEEAMVDALDGQIQMQDFSSIVENEHQDGDIVFNPDEKLPKLVYPYGVKKIEAQEANDDIYFSYREGTNEIFANSHNAEGNISIDQYSFEFNQPTFSLKALRQVGEEDPENIKEQYTQLPDSLPQRVRDLALEITADKDTRYDKAKAIENYLKSSQFRYLTTGVAVPDEDEDYVDQFLFETMIGYCDNFSTSMVVLLRTLDIPARWVKGFAPGDIADTLQDGYERYEITNANAHSWVEVYFPEIGWVPFEPTKGFNNPVDFTSGIDLDELLENHRDQQPIEPAPEKEKPAPKDNNKSNSKNSDSFFANLTWKFWMFSGFGLIIVGFILYWKRYKWLTWFKIKSYRRKKDIDTYIKAYKYLLALLSSKGYTKNEDQTLREFALLIDRKLESIDMRILTTQYEKILYRNEEDYGQWEKMSEAWEGLVIRILKHM
jgi:hypothetical protein